MKTTSGKSNNVIFFILYIIVLIMYTIYFLVRIFFEDVAKKIFLGATVLCATNSIVYLISSLQNNTIVDTVVSSLMIALSLLLGYYYIAYLMNKPRPVSKVRKGLRYITAAEQWVNKNKRNKDFDKLLDKKLERKDQRFGEEWVYSPGNKISSQQLRQRINQMRVAKLMKERTLDKKIQDLTQLARLYGIPNKQKREKKLDRLMSEDPTFAHQIVANVKSDDMPQNATDKKVLKTIAEQGIPVRKQALNQMLTIFGQPVKKDQQMQRQFFEKLSTDLSDTKQKLFKNKQPFQSEKFIDSFLNQIKDKDASIWFKEKVRTQGTTDKDLMRAYIKNIMKAKRDERRSAVSRTKGGIRSSFRSRRR